MNQLVLPNLKVGTVVVTPCDAIPELTQDKHYVVLGIQDEWLKICNDFGDIRYYQAHLFIEANVYYNMLIWLVMMRMFDLNPNDL